MALTHKQKTIALSRLHGGKNWILRGNVLDWNEQEPIPTATELQDEYNVFLAEESDLQDEAIVMENHVATERAALPTWIQVKNAIDSAFPDTTQAAVIRKIARPVYTMLKKTID